MIDFKKKDKKYLILTIIVTALAIAFNIFIVVQASLNGSMSTSSSGIAVNFFKSIINAFHKDAINESNIDTFRHVIRKLIGHFSFFMISGLLSSLAIHLSSAYLNKYKYWYGVIFSLCFGLFLAGLTELIQSFIPSRSGQITDVLIDFSGYILGTGIIVLIVFLVIRQHKKKVQ